MMTMPSYVDGYNCQSNNLSQQHNDTYSASNGMNLINKLSNALDMITQYIAHCLNGIDLSYDNKYLLINFLEQYGFIQSDNVKNYILSNEFLIPIILKAIEDIYEILGEVPIHLEYQKDVYGEEVLYIVAKSNTIEVFDLLAQIENRYNLPNLKIVPWYKGDKDIISVFRDGNVNEFSKLLLEKGVEFKYSDSHLNLSEDMKKAALMNAFIAHMVFCGEIKSIIISNREEDYPEVRITPSYDISSEEWISKLKKISRIAWCISDGEDGILLVSVILDRLGGGYEL